MHPNQTDLHAQYALKSKYLQLLTDELTALRAQIETGDIPRTPHKTQFIHEFHPEMVNLHGGRKCVFVLVDKRGEDFRIGYTTQCVFNAMGSIDIEADFDRSCYLITDDPSALDKLLLRFLKLHAKPSSRVANPKWYDITSLAPFETVIATGGKSLGFEAVVGFTEAGQTSIDDLFDRHRYARLKLSSTGERSPFDTLDRMTSVLNYAQIKATAVQQDESSFAKNN